MFSALFLSVSFLNLYFIRQALSSWAFSSIFSVFPSVNHSSGAQKTFVIHLKLSTRLIKISPHFLTNSFSSGVVFSKVDGVINSHELNNVDNCIDHKTTCSGKDENEKVIYNKTKDLADAYYLQAIVFTDQGDLDRAIKCLNNSIHLRPDFAEYYFMRAKALLEKKEFDKVVEDCTKAMHLNFNCVTDYYICRGKAYRENGDDDRAIADFSFVLKLEPNNVDAYKLRSGVYAEIGYYDLAAKDYAQEARLFSNSSVTVVNFKKGLLK